MKTTVVPAQITTVEDKIAGSLTLPQIVLMVIPLIVGSAIYIGVPPKMHLGAAKLTLIIIQFAIFGALAIRVGGKIVVDWLIIYLRYRLRPRRYIYTKKDLAYREIAIKEKSIEAIEHQKEAIKIQDTANPPTLLEQLTLHKLLDNDGVSLSFKPSKKGGINVSLEQKKN